MLVLALLFVPVMADAGNPREAEFSPPANEGVAIAAAAASLVGWLYVASAGGNPEKRRRVDVAGTMGQYFNHLPQDRPSNAARAAAGARLAVAPDFPLNGSGSATSGSAVSASVSTTVPHPTSAPAHAASHDSGSGTSVAPTPSHVAPRYVVGAQWGYKNLCTGEMEKVRHYWASAPFARPQRHGPDRPSPRRQVEGHPGLEAHSPPPRRPGQPRCRPIEPRGDTRHPVQHYFPRRQRPIHCQLRHRREPARTYRQHQCQVSQWPPQPQRLPPSVSLCLPLSLSPSLP